MLWLWINRYVDITYFKTNKSFSSEIAFHILTVFHLFPIPCLISCENESHLRHIKPKPVTNNNPWMLLYFISFLLIVSFFVLNMFVGVVVENFHKCRQHQEVEEAKRREEKRQRRMEKKRRSKNEDSEQSSEERF